MKTTIKSEVDEQAKAWAVQAMAKFQARREAQLAKERARAKASRANKKKL